MPLPVRNVGADKNELIEHAAEVLGRSVHKRRVFQAIYTGKQHIKTVQELVRSTRLSQRRVLDAGKTLSSQDLVEQVRENKETGYKKISFFQTFRDRILRYPTKPLSRGLLPTKRRPTSILRLSVPIRFPANRANAKHISVDEIDSFKKARAIPHGRPYTRISETNFKKGVARILGETGRFKDWGGENSDLSSTRVMLIGKRRMAAFAFKGPGVSGKLFPGKMGKNGDQIQRLLRCPAEIFIVQYWGQIDDSVLEQLRDLSRLKAYLNASQVWYGVIDGTDSTRLIEAYPKAFGFRP